MRSQRTLVCLVALLSLLVAACGGRSTEAFCSTWESENQRLRDKYEARLEQAGDSDPLVGLIAAVGISVEAAGDVKVMYDRLEAKAPEEIAPDVAAVRDALAAQLEAMRDSASNPLGSLFGGLITGLAVSGADQRVNQFISDNCDV